VTRHEASHRCVSNFCCAGTHAGMEGMKSHVPGGRMFCAHTHWLGPSCTPAAALCPCAIAIFYLLPQACGACWDRCSCYSYHTCKLLTEMLGLSPFAGTEEHRMREAGVVGSGMGTGMDTGMGTGMGGTHTGTGMGGMHSESKFPTHCVSSQP